MTSPEGASRRDRHSAVREVALLFLKLGTIGFGGPAAHIALMEQEVVARRQWLTRDEFLDYLGAANLVPGPNSTELAIHIGRARAGKAGLLVAGAAFILPAFLIVTAVAWGYVRYGSLPLIGGPLAGIKAAMIAVVAHALWVLGRSAVKSAALAAVGVLAVLALCAGVHELLVLGGAALLAAGVRLQGRPGRRASVPILAGLAGGGLSAVPAAAQVPFSLAHLFFLFVKTGAVLFGSGYVLLAYLRADFVDRLGWISDAQLLDAIAVGQLTPGPVFTTATFVGYLVAGLPGAVAATVGIFLPAFLFVAISGPLVPRLRRSHTAGALLDGLNVASLALMAVVAWQLGTAVLTRPLWIVTAVLGLLVLLRWRLNPAWLLAGGALAGVVAT